MKRLPLLFLAVLLFCGLVFSTDYYVDVTTGNDADDGLSEGNAWKTMGKVDAFDAATGFNAGDNIYFNCGETWSGANASKLSITSSGTSGNPITFGKYGTGALPVLQLSTDIIFYGTGIDYITIQDIEFDGDDNTDYNGVQFGNAQSTNIIIQRCLVHGCRTGIPLHMVDTVTVDDCTVYDCSNNGILCQGSAATATTNVIVQNCTVYNITNNDGICIHKDGSLNDVGANFYFYNNEVYNCKEQGFDINTGSNVLLLDNTTYDNDNAGIVHGTALGDFFIIGHYSYSEDYGAIYGSTCPGLRILKSIVYAATRCDVEIGVVGTSDAYVAQNTFISTAQQTRNPFRLHSNLTSFIARNNIIISTESASPNKLVKYQTGTPAGTSSDWDYNQYWRADDDDTQELWNGLNFADWITAGFDANGAFGDPQIVDAGGGDFSVASDSPCVDAGGWLTTISTANGSGTTFTVADSKWFHAGFGLTTGSEVQLEGDATSVTVTAVNWTTGAITVDSSVTWTQGDGVALQFYGAAPDIGWYEFPIGDPDPDIAVFYVDATDGSDAADGSSPASAWQTISKVNGETFDPADQILFQKGETWREELDTVSSGTSGNQIVISSYGTGADPIINGADIISTWTADLSTGSTWTAVAQTGQSASDYSSATWVNWRNIIKAATSSTSGTKIRIKVKGHSSNTGYIDGAAIGIRNGSTDEYSGSPTNITFDTGSNTATVTAGSFKWSDWMTFTFDEAVDHFVHIFSTHAHNASWSRWSGSSVDETYGDQTDSDLSETSPYSGTAIQYPVGIEEIEVEYGTANVWKATLATEPNQVFFDGTRGNAAANKASVDSANDWFWDSNVLYVYYTEDPDGAVVIEASVRDQCVYIGYDDDYIDVTGLNLKYANKHNIMVGQLADYCNVYSNTISYSAKRGVYVYLNATNIKIYSNTISYSGVALATQEHGIYLDGCSDIDVYLNEISHSWDCGIKIDGCSAVDVYRNYAHDNAQEDQGGTSEIGVYSNTDDADDVDIYYNLILQSKDYAIRINDETNDITNVRIYNNVLIGNSGYENYVYLFANTDGGLVFKNNIVYADGVDKCMYEVDNTGYSSDYNSYYGWVNATHIGYIDAVWTSWATLSSTETNSINSDPLMTDPANGDFTLQETSPCVDAGTDVGLNHDYWGDEVPHNNYVDIGADESSYAYPPEDPPTEDPVVANLVTPNLAVRLAANLDAQIIHHRTPKKY